MSEERIKRIKRAIRKKNSHKRKRGKNWLSFKSYMLETLEDSKNLRSLANVTARGTRKAHQHAVNTSDEIIYVRNGKVIREVKGKKSEVIQELAPRKVLKGTTITISR